MRERCLLTWSPSSSARTGRARPRALHVSVSEMEPGTPSCRRAGGLGTWTPRAAPSPRLGRELWSAWLRPPHNGTGLQEARWPEQLWGDSLYSLSQTEPGSQATDPRVPHSHSHRAPGGHPQHSLARGTGARLTAHHPLHGACGGAGRTPGVQRQGEPLPAPTQGLTAGFTSLQVRGRRKASWRQ